MPRGYLLVSRAGTPQPGPASVTSSGCFRKGRQHSGSSVVIVVTLQGTSNAALPPPLCFLVGFGETCIAVVLGADGG